MKKIGFVFLVILTLSFLISLVSEEFTYVGSAKCKICHNTEKQGQQYPIWKESKHSQSFAALTSEQTVQDAKEAGMEKMPAENPKCLLCHAPLSQNAEELKEEGVTCEVCHGPGSAYKKLNIMKNKEEAVQNGLVVYGSPDAIKQKCLSCHENAHEKPFDFEMKWNKIKHPRPDKE